MLEFRRILIRRFSSLFQKRRLDEDLDQELHSHVELAIEANLRQGMSAEEARREALRSFGGIEQTKEIYREQRGLPMIETMFQDVRYGLRMLAQSPGFTAVAVLSLALGIGANTAIYSFMDAILLRALPVQHPEQLVVLNWHSKDFPEVAHNFSGGNYKDPATGFTSGNQPYPAFELLRANNHVFSSMFAFNYAGSLTVTVAGHAELAGGDYVSGGYFSGLGVPAAAGRLIGDDDDRIGAAPVVVISYNFWRRRFASVPAAVGQTIMLNNTPRTIVGVSAPEFFGVAPGGAPDLFIPLHAMPNAARRFAQRNSYWVLMMGRLRPGVSISRAQSELSPLYHRFVADSASNAKERADLPALLLQEGGSGINVMRRRYSKPLYVLMTVVGLLLAIACANVANLLLSRATARRREIAVRLSLGAGRLRVVRQLLTESLLLGLAGGLLGALVAAPGIRFIEWLIANGREDFRTGAALDWRVLGFTLAIALLTSVIFGLAPAIQATRVDLTPALKETRASAPRAHALNARMLRGIGLGQILVVSQIAISLLLVVAAGLFVRTLSNLESITLGFNRENVLLFSMQARQTGYQDTALVRLYEELRTRFASTPGVLGASLSDFALVSGGISRTGLKIPGVVNPPGREAGTAVLHVGAGFFSTMQIPILLGREIGERDNTEAPRVAVVNEVFAKKYFAAANPVGRRFGLGDANKFPDIEIVGVSRTARYNSLKEDIPPTVYIPYSQDLGVLNYMVFELRTSGEPLAFVSAVRRIVDEISPRVPVFNVTTQSAQIDRTIGQERTFAELCTCFAVLALAIACVGLYGTMAYAVSRRTNEIGIRIALGAERARIIWMVLREVFALSTVGLATGLAAAWVTARFVESFLFGMKARDPLALSLSVAILVASAIAAGYAPAWRASRIDPMDALRHE